jgi:hypothetical protein
MMVLLCCECEQGEENTIHRRDRKSSSISAGRKGGREHGDNSKRVRILGGREEEEKVRKKKRKKR